MPELEVPDAPEDDQDSPGSEEEMSTPEEEAESEGAAEAEETEEEGEVEEESEGEEGKAPSAYDKLLAKYGGDKEKLANSYFEQGNSNARLHERLEAIEKFIKGQAAPKVDVEAEIQQDRDYKDLKQKFDTAQGRLEALDREQTSTVTEYGKIDKKVERLEGKLEAADVESKPEIREDLREARAERERVMSRLQSIRERAERLRDTLNDIAEKGQRAEQAVRDRVDKKRQQEAQDASDHQQVRGQFAEAMAQEASRFGIDTDSKQFSVLFHSVKDRLSTYLGSLPPDAPGVDVPEAVHTLMSEYAEVMGLKAKFQRDSKVKRGATSEPPKRREVMPAGAKDVKPPKDGRWTKSYVDERAKRLLGG